MLVRRLIAATIVAAGLALAGCTTTHLPPDPAPSPQLVLWDRTWSYESAPGQEILTQHYHVYTTHTDPEYLKRLPLFIENAFTHYQQMVKPTRRPDAPMDVYVFGKRDQWERFTAATTASSAIYRKIQEGGYCDSGRAVFYDIPMVKMFAVTGHECFHLYISHYAKNRPPAWLDEGLACYFEAFSWEGETVKFDPKRNLLRKSALASGLADRSLLDVSELLSTHAGNIIGSTNAKVGSYYAQLWALIVFLQDDPTYKARFAKLLGDVGSQKMMEMAASAGYGGQNADFGPAIFKAYITTDLATFKLHFQAYCVKLVGFSL